MPTKTVEPVPEPSPHRLEPTLAPEPSRGADSASSEVIFIPNIGSEEDLAQAAYLASLADPTPQGKLLTRVAREKIGTPALPSGCQLVAQAEFRPVCGVNLGDSHGHTMIREGSMSSIEDWVRNMGGYIHSRVRRIVSQIASHGGVAIVVATESVILGVIHVKSGRIL